jgi:hypothetical protein
MGNMIKGGHPIRENFGGRYHQDFPGREGMEAKGMPTCLL